MSPPLVSTIIPTHNRPQWLSNAIKSALSATPNGHAEVIVIPNGPDESWRAVASQFRHDQRVIWHKIETPHANAARNQGMALATGRYIRFLDDDDYLYPDQCKEQCKLLLQTNGDICSGGVDIEVNGQTTKSWKQPNTNDLVAATLSPSRLTAIHAHIYRREHLSGLHWSEQLSVRQDTDWLMRVAASREAIWIRISEPVCAWVQHSSPRVSRGRDPGSESLKNTATMLISAINYLDSTNRLSRERLEAAADGLWSGLQKGLKYDYSYWRNIAKIANGYAPNRTPPSRIYRNKVVKNIDPLLIETLLIPLRWAYHPARRILEPLGIART